MLVLRVVQRERAELAGEVADVVQQGGGDESSRLALLLGELRALQHVLGHGDRFAEIFLAAAPFEDVAEERARSCPA